MFWIIVQVQALWNSGTCRTKFWLSSASPIRQYCVAYFVLSLRKLYYDEINLWVYITHSNWHHHCFVFAVTFINSVAVMQQLYVCWTVSSDSDAAVLSVSVMQLIELVSSCWSIFRFQIPACVWLISPRGESVQETALTWSVIALGNFSAKSR
jgi:hypothetical protein